MLQSAYLYRVNWNEKWHSHQHLARYFISYEEVKIPLNDQRHTLYQTRQSKGIPSGFLHSTTLYVSPNGASRLAPVSLCSISLARGHFRTKKEPLGRVMNYTLINLRELLRNSSTATRRTLFVPISSTKPVVVDSAVVSYQIEAVDCATARHPYSVAVCGFHYGPGALILGTNLGHNH